VTLILHDWRLPNIKEFQSIVDYGETDPAIDTIYFSVKFFGAAYWSSTVWSEFPEDTGWYVSFITGKILYANSDEGKFLRAVRGGHTLLD